MSLTLAPSIIFGLSLLLNWKLVAEYYNRGQFAQSWTINANAILLIAAVIFLIIYLRKVLRRLEAILIAHKVIREKEKIVKWWDSLLAPLPVLFTMTYSWLSSSTPQGKFTLQYGGTGFSALLYFLLVAFLVLIQIETKLKVKPD